MKIRTRIYSGFATTVAIGVCLAGFALYQLVGIGAQMRAMDGRAANLSHVLEATTEVEAIRRTETRYRMLPEDATRAELKEHSAIAVKLLTEVEATTVSQERERIYREVKATLQSHDQTFDQFAQLLATAAVERGKLFRVGDEMALATNTLFDAAVAVGDFQDMKQAAAVRGTILLVRIANWRYLATSDRNGPETFNGNVAKARAALAEFGNHASATERPLLGSIATALDGYAAAFAAVSDAQKQSVELYDTKLRPLSIDMQTKLRTAVVSLEGSYAESSAASAAIISQTSTLQVSLAGLGLVIGAALALLIGRSIAGSISGMTEAMGKLAGGNKSIAIPGIESTDEIGEMARAVEVFKQNAIEADRVAARQDDERVQKGLRTTRVESSVRGFETRIGQMVERLASGSTELEATAQSMSATAARANEQAATVAAAAEKASIGVETVASAAEELTASIGEITLNRAGRDDCWDTAMVAFHLMDQVARKQVFPHTLANRIGTLMMFAVRSIFARLGQDRLPL